MDLNRTTTRRGFLHASDRTDRAQGAIHVAGLVVMTRPEHLERVRDGLSRLAGAEVAVSDPCGKLVVVLDAPSDAALADLMSRIPDIPGVLVCTLAHHHGEDVPEALG